MPGSLRSSGRHRSSILQVAHRALPERSSIRKAKCDDLERLVDPRVAAAEPMRRRLEDHGVVPEKERRGGEVAPDLADRITSLGRDDRPSILRIAGLARADPL